MFYSTTSRAGVVRIWSIVLATLALGTQLTGCNVDGGPTSVSPDAAVTSNAPVRSITVVVASSSLVVGTTTQATPTLHGPSGAVLTDRPVTWASSDLTIATVSAAGIVSAVAPGQAQITARSGDVAGNASVTVTAPAAPTPTPPSPVTGEVMATLPQVYVDTRLPAAPAQGGKVISVSAGGNLQSALNSALPGDVIELENGATFSGNFMLQNKNTASTSWITIRPASMNGMPAEGARMTPTIASAVNLPKLLSINNQGAIATAAGAHHYRLIGLDVSVPATIANTGLVRFDGQQTTLAQVPHHLVIDRSFVHGTATGTVRRCVTLNSAHSAVIDSYLSDCHDAGTDAQAIAAWNSPGPLKIVNNYLEGSGENIMFGGADPGVPNMITSDIEIRRNHLFKPTAWKGKWLVKNIFELKSASRVLFEGNVLDGSWQDGQGGNAINLKSSNQDGACTSCGTSDVTIRYNIIRNVGSGFILSGAPDFHPTNVHLQRVTVMHNVMTIVNAGNFLGDGRGLLINGDPADIVFAHNTIMGSTNSAITFGGPAGAVIRGSIRDNVMGGGAYGVKGAGYASGSASLTAFMPNGAFSGNVLVIPSPAGYPTGNFYPASAALIGFQNAGAYDYQLTLSSPYRLKGTDGRDPGADITAVNTAVSGVIVP